MITSGTRTLGNGSVVTEFQMTVVDWINLSSTEKRDTLVQALSVERSKKILLGLVKDGPLFKLLKAEPRLIVLWSSKRIMVEGVDASAIAGYETPKVKYTAAEFEALTEEEMVALCDTYISLDRAKGIVGTTISKGFTVGPMDAVNWSNGRIAIEGITKAKGIGGGRRGAKKSIEDLFSGIELNPSTEPVSDEAIISDTEEVDPDIEEVDPDIIDKAA